MLLQFFVKLADLFSLGDEYREHHWLKSWDLGRVAAFFCEASACFYHGFEGFAVGLPQCIQEALPAFDFFF